MSKTLRKSITYGIAILTVVFIFLGMFDWIEIWRGSFWGPLSAGESIKVENVKKYNNIIFILCCGLPSIGLLHIRKCWCQVLSTVLSCFNGFYCFLSVLAEIRLIPKIMEKIGESYTYTVTMVGYIAVVVSWIIVALQIILLIDLLKDKRSF